MDRCLKCQGEFPGNVKYCSDCAVNSCKTCSGFIFNAVLAYCQCFLKNYGVSEVSKAVAMLFSEEDIVQARRVIQDNCKDLIPSTHPIIEKRNRKNSGVRSALQACVNDITSAVYEIVQAEKGPSFITMDISHLPLVRPTSGEGDQDERILRLEKQLEAFEKRINGTESKLETLSPAMNNIPTPMSYAQKVRVPPTPSLGDGRSNDELSMVKIASQQATPANSASSDTGNVIQVTSHPNSSGQENEWRRPRHHMLGERKRNNRAQGLRGKAAGTEIKSRIGGPNRDMWISNVDRSMSDENLKTFIEGGGSQKSGNVDIRLWEARYIETYDTKCFRLTIGKSDYERVYNEDFWPEDIHVRKYWLSAEEKKSSIVRN